ncbi:hypothetical protein F2P56_033245 [Juglans regia]|uniref:F-box domain-containing protein n=2 Tax=Juglans regia TaxID=51240 RepID=A0A833X814_JUGRE|nr:F-box protein At3g07870-like [Juglans regia]KAF5447715.1 hypothetical protein F2P56_033245 [Juglans regia]
MSDFPSDILFDIFLRLPIKSLLRFRCVSPFWRNIIDDPCLAYVHRTRFAEESRVLLLDHPKHKPDVTFREDHGGFLKASLSLVTQFATLKAYFFEGCCNGLVCFTKSCDDSLVFLFNPLRHEVLALQPRPCSSTAQTSDPPLRKRKYGLGFDCSKNTYKIVRVFENQRNSTLCAEVFTLGRSSSSSSWRSAIGKGPDHCPLFGRPIFACGALHWLSIATSEDDHNNNNLEGNKIVSFDISKEEFGLISTPKSFLSCHLLDLRGDLAIVDCSSDRQIEIWVLKEYAGKIKKWVKEYEIGLKAPIGAVDNTWIEVIGIWEEGEILVRYVGSFLSYDPKTDGLRYIHIPGFSHHDDTEVLCHKGTLLSLSRFQEEEL